MTGDSGAAVGAEVRRHRLARGWTLDEAAARLGISRRFLVQLEAGGANPSLSTLLSVAAGLDVPLVALLAGVAAPDAIVPVERADAPVLWSTPAGSEARLLAGRGALELWSWTLAAGEERHADAHRPGSQEVATVSAGTLAVTVGRRGPVEVRAGHSLAFPADEPHRYANPTSRPTRFLLAVHEPSAGT